MKVLLPREAGRILKALGFLGELEAVVMEVTEWNIVPVSGHYGI